MSRLLATLCLIATLCSTVLAQEDPQVRVIFEEPELTYVGQRVPFAIEILTTGQLNSAVQFDLPRAPDAFLLQVQGAPTFGSEKIKSVSFTSYRYEFALYPRTAGPHSIPAIAVRSESTLGFGQPATQFRLTTEPATLEAVLPPGAENLSMLISAPRFTVVEEWDKQPGAAIVGDAFRQTITMSAEDILGMALPELGAPEIDGLRIYAKRAEVDDKIERGQITGKVTQTFIYVCEQAGSFTTPQLAISWFDLNAKQLKTETISSVYFEVTPDPTAPVRPAATAAAPDNRALNAILVSCSVLLIAAWALRKRFSAFFAERRNRAATSLVHVRTACRQDDVQAALQSLLRHIDATCKPGTAMTATAWAAQYCSPQLESATAELERCFVTRAQWSGSKLLAALPRRRPPKTLASRGLGSLNPGQNQGQLARTD